MLAAQIKISTVSSGEDRGSGRFTAEQIAQAIARYDIKPTSQFTAEQIAVKCLESLSSKRPQLKVRSAASRRHHRGYRYGDCHWAGK